MLGAQGELRNSYNCFKEARRERSSFRLSLIGTEIIKHYSIFIFLGYLDTEFEDDEKRKTAN